MKKFTLFVAALALAGAAVTVACGTTDGTTDGTGSIKTCTADADCGSNSICHPTGKVCVPTCNAAADCPANQKNCAPIGSGTTKVCQCATSQLCQGEGGSADLICSGTDNICEKKCATDSDCSGFTSRKCDTAKGECVVGTTPVTKCTANADCASSAAGKVCNTTSGACVQCLANSDCTTAGQTCDTASNTCKAPQGTACNASAMTVGTAGGFDTCSYGQVCTNSLCAANTQSCDAATNYVPAMGTSGKAPVVYDVVDTGTTRTATIGGCANKANAIHQFSGKFYDPDGDVASTSVYSHIFYITTDGQNPGTSGNTYEKVSITKDAGGKTGTFTFELCDDLKTNAHPANGAVIADGAGNESNVGCFTWK